MDLQCLIIRKLHIIAPNCHFPIHLYIKLVWPWRSNLKTLPNPQFLSDFDDFFIYLHIFCYTFTYKIKTIDKDTDSAISNCKVSSRSSQGQITKFGKFASKCSLRINNQNVIFLNHKSYKIKCLLFLVMTHRLLRALHRSRCQASSHKVSSKDLVDEYM